MIEATQGATAVSFDGKIVTINRKFKPGMTLIGNGDHVIPLSGISGIEWKPAGRFTPGRIRFAVAGSQAASARTAHNQDENSVSFSRKTEPAFDKLRAQVQAALSQ